MKKCIGAAVIVLALILPLLALVTPHTVFSMESMLCLVKIILVSIPGILMKDAVIQNVMMIGSFFKIIISLVLRFDNLFVKVFGEAC